MIELDREERRRGAVKHIYRLAPVNGLADDVAKLADDLRSLSIAVGAKTAAELSRKGERSTDPGGPNPAAPFPTKQRRNHGA